MASTIPLSRFNIRLAKIGVHLRLHECHPFTYMTDAESLRDVLGQVDWNKVIPTSHDHFQQAREVMRHQLKIAQRTRDDTMAQTVGLMSLWLILNMPGHEDDMRRKALDGFASGARSYIYTVACNERIAYVVVAGTKVASDALLDQQLTVATSSKASFYREF